MKSLARDWLRVKALPLWATTGRDPQGGFTERLAPDGRPDHEAPKRIRVQARQIFTYARAARHGLYPGAEECVRHGLEFLSRIAPQPRAKGYPHTVDREGRALSHLRDTYDHAFLILAFAESYALLREDRLEEALDDTVSFVEARLQAPAGDGFFEDAEHSLPRRQNPHMHLLEALLAAFEATGERRHLDQAGMILELLRGRFLHGLPVRLIEFFEEDWRPAEGEKGRIIEPGHHYEWVWLLGEYARLSGGTLAGEAEALFRAASAMGHASDRLVIDECWVDGRPKSRTKRCWPQTEYIRALIVGERMGWPLPDTPSAATERLFRHYLEPALPGAWFDVMDEAGGPLKGPIPASTFYHVMGALSALMGLPQ